MNNITDFNDVNHRVFSACAVFQKGIYHLFMLKEREAADAYAQILRGYQVLFQLALTLLLLDLDYRLKREAIPPRLRKLCRQGQTPTRREIDPAAIVTHSVFENQRWQGFKRGHPLHQGSKTSLQLYLRIVEARHNLIYRPFMLDGFFWEDCSLMDLLETVPSANEAEEAYKKVLHGMLEWDRIEKEETEKWIQDLRKRERESRRSSSAPVQENSSRLRCAGYFLESLFMVYVDRRNHRPTETLLASYARMMNPGDEGLLRSIKTYRNELIGLQKVLSAVTTLEEWKAGEL